MNVHEADTPPLEVPAGDDAQPDAAVADKPKRRRAPRKTAVAPPVGELAEQAAPSATASASLAVDVALAADAGAAATTRTPQAVAATATPSGDPGETHVPAEATAAVADAARDGGGDGGDEGDEGDGGDDGATDGATDGGDATAGGAGSRRGRNRRRGRRGAERGERIEGAEGDPSTAGDGEPAAATEGRAEGEAPAAPRAPAPQAAEVFAQVLSGVYDEATAPAEGAESEPAPKRVLAAEPDTPKLHKVLAQAGVGSRRDLEQMITEGRVAVNGEPAHTGQRISFGDRISVDGKPVRVRIAPPPPRVLAYHKPAGEVVTHDDPQQRPTVFRRLPRLQHGKWQSVGRLDINTEGLLLFTNSGELANQLMHPRFGVEREYAVRSLGLLEPEAKAQLLEGVEIYGQRAAFKSIEDGGGEGVNHWYRVVITEGRNREVRKLFEAVGHAVSRLIRIRYGSVVLPHGLKRGVWVDLDEHDLRTLRRLAAGPRPEREVAPDAERGPRRSRNRRGGKRAEGAERGPRPEGPESQPRPPRPEATGPRPERGPRPAREGFESGEGGAIPNPLQQTFDRRAIQQERQRRREIPEDGPIPNPLQQTYDKRALQRDRTPQRDMPEDGPIPNPLQQTYDKRFAQGGRGQGGFGPGGSAPHAGKRGGGGARRGGSGGGEAKGGGQPDPLRTSVGYIGADAFRRKSGGPAGGKRGGGRGGRGR